MDRPLEDMISERQVSVRTTTCQQHLFVRFELTIFLKGRGTRGGRGRRQNNWPRDDTRKVSGL